MADSVNHIEVLITSHDLASKNLGDVADNLDAHIKRLGNRGGEVDKTFKSLDRQIKNYSKSLREAATPTDTNTRSASDLRDKLKSLVDEYPRLTKRINEYYTSIKAQDPLAVSKGLVSQKKLLADIDKGYREASEALTRYTKWGQADTSQVEASIQAHRRLAAIRTEANKTAEIERLLDAYRKEESELQRNIRLHQRRGEVMEEAARAGQRAQRYLDLNAAFKDYDTFYVKTETVSNGLERLTGNLLQGIANFIGFGNAAGRSKEDHEKLGKAANQLEISFRMLFSRMAIILIGIPAVAAGIGSLTVLSYGLVGGIASLLGPIGNLTGLLIGLPAATAAAGAGLAGLLGISAVAGAGVAKAYQAINANADKIGKIGADATSPGRKKVDPGKQADASKDLQNARIEAARSVADAERDLARARLDGGSRVREAEDDLFRTRSDAARDLEDLETDHNKDRLENIEAIAEAEEQLARDRRDWADKLEDALQRQSQDNIRRAEAERDAVVDLERLKRDAAEREMDLLRDIEELRSGINKRRAGEEDRLRNIQEQNANRELELIRELQAAQAAMAAGGGVSAPDALKRRVSGAQAALDAQRVSGTNRVANQQANIAIAGAPNEGEAARLAELQDRLADVQLDNSEKIADAELNLARLRRDNAADQKDQAEDVAEIRVENAEKEKDALRDLADLRKTLDDDDAKYAKDLAKLKLDNSRNIKDSEEALAKAQLDRTRSVFDAETRLADARRQGAERIRNAENSLASASVASNEAAIRANNLLAFQLAQLDPLQVKVARRLMDLKDRWMELTKAFRDDALNFAMRGFEQLDKDLPGIANKIGGFNQTLLGLGDRLLKVAQNPFWRTIIGNVADQANANLGMMGRMFINLGLALLLVMDAARPFTDWLFKSIENWSNYVLKSAEAGRETGKLATFFDHTKESAQLFWDILTNIGGTLFNLGAIGRETGMGLLGSFENVTRGWKKFSEDTSKGGGVSKIQEFFETSAPAMRVLGNLIRALGKEFISVGERIASNDKFMKTLEGIGKPGGLLDQLGDSIVTLTTEFGPKILRFFEELSKTFSVLASNGGPLSVIIDMLSGLLHAFNALPGPIQKALLFLTTGFILWFKVLGPGITILRAFFSLSGGLGTMLKMWNLLAVAVRGFFTLLLAGNPIGWIVLAIVAVVAIIVVLWKKNEAFRNFIKALWEDIQKIFHIAVDKAVAAFDKIKNWLDEFLKADWKERFKMMASAWWAGIKLELKLLWEGLKLYLESYLKLWGWLWDAFKASLPLAWDGIKKLLELYWEGVKLYFSTAFNILKGLFGALWDGIKAALPAAWNGIKHALVTAWEGIKGYFTDAAGWVGRLFTGIWESVKNAIPAAWAGIYSAITTAWAGIRDYFGSIKTVVVNRFSSAWETVKDAIPDAWNAIYGKITEHWGTIREYMGKIPGLIIGFFGDAWTGITGAIPAAFILIKNAIAGAIAGAINAIIGGVEFLGKKFNGLLKTVKLDGIVPDMPDKFPRVKAEDFGGEKKATGGYVQTAPGGVYMVAEAGHDELVLSTDPKYRQRSMGLVADYMQRMGVTHPNVPKFATGGWVTGKTANLNPGLLEGLNDWGSIIKKVVNIISGFRSRAEQEALYAAYLNGTGNLAAVPGTSNHEKGLAADTYVGGIPLQRTDMTGEVSESTGIHFPVPGEPWHAERKGLGSGAMTLFQSIFGDTTFGEFIADKIGKSPFASTEFDESPIGSLGEGMGEKFYEMFKKATAYIKGAVKRGAKKVKDSVAGGASWAGKKIEGGASAIWDAFQNGGEVEGETYGAPKGIIAHVGEWVLNAKQQAIAGAPFGGPENLKRQLFATPSTPYAMAGGSPAAFAGAGGGGGSSNSKSTVIQLGPVYTTQPDIDIDYIAEKLKRRMDRDA